MATTDANGSYSFTRSESSQGSYILAVAFYGNTNYLQSSEMLFLTIGNPAQDKISANVTIITQPSDNPPPFPDP